MPWGGGHIPPPTHTPPTNRRLGAFLLLDLYDTLDLEDAGQVPLALCHAVLCMCPHPAKRVTVTIVLCAFNLHGTVIFGVIGADVDSSSPPFIFAFVHSISLKKGVDTSIKNVYLGCPAVDFYSGWTFIRGAGFTTVVDALYVFIYSCIHIMRLGERWSFA